MTTPPKKQFNFWKELKRRNVLRSLAIYAGTAFIILEASTILFPRWGLPDWTIDLIIWLLVLGAVINVFIAWFYDITSGGMQKTMPLEETKGKEKQPTSKGWKVATYFSIVVIVGLILLNVVGRPTQLHAGDIQSIVILPFDNFTGDDQLDYFVDGMHASLINDMGKLSGLRIISKTSASAFKDMDLTASEIAKELNVDAVVEGSIMCLGDSICSQFRLVNTSGEEKQIWNADYKEEKSQVLNLYSRITKQVADEVLIELTEDEKQLLARNRTVDQEAYDAFLRGHQYWDDLSRESLNKAMEYLNQAVEKDPDWAPPYAGLAKVWTGMAQMGYVTGNEAFPMIFGNLGKALELDPNLPDVHFTTGIIAVWVEWNWEKGEKELLQAIANNPNDAMSRMYYAHLLSILQRPEEASLQGKLAAELDPLNPLIQSLYAVVLVDVSGWEAGYKQNKKALAMDPDSHFAGANMDLYAFHTGDFETIIETFMHFHQFDPENIKSIEATYSTQGLDSAYKEIIYVLKGEKYSGITSPFDFAARYAYINHSQKALEWVKKGYETHDQNMPYILTGLAGLDSLYDDPEFLDLLKVLKLPMPTQ